MPSVRRQTPVETYIARRRTITLLWVLLALVIVAALVYWRYLAERPVDYAEIEEQFKYGSIGSDSDGGIPYWLWQVLPEMFPQYLPDPEAYLAIPPEERSEKDGYEQFGFLYEPGRELPIGISQRRLTVDRVGINCAACHTGTLRVSEGMEVERLYDSTPHYLSESGERLIILGMPATSMNLRRFFEFLFSAVQDSDFTADNVMRFIDAETQLDPIERFLYRQAVPLVRETLLTRRQQLSFLAQVPEFGPGRVDTFNPYKTIQYDLPYDGTIGTADLPSMWNQRPRVGMQLHWDGNNTSVFERNLSAAIGVGATPDSLDIPRILRVASWVGSPDPSLEADEEEVAQLITTARLHPVPAADELAIPRYPFAIDEAKAAHGASLYEQRCASCHDFQGEQIGQVVPIDEIGTDRQRLDSFTEELLGYQNTLGSGYWWQFSHFQKTHGYANMPLDGLWARAPYLHNGSVPTLRDLLKVPESRPAQFYRGDDEYDPDFGGFRADRPNAADGRKLFLFDTTLPGNGNGGHSYGTELSDEEKEALLEYLKTL